MDVQVKKKVCRRVFPLGCVHQNVTRQNAAAIMHDDGCGRSDFYIQTELNQLQINLRSEAGMYREPNKKMK